MATSPSQKVLLIGLDSADAALIERWAQEGHLPVLRSLMEEGAWGRLGTTADLAHASVWPTLFTGTGPGEHGIYNFVQTIPGTYEVSRVRADQRTQPNFWEYLDRTGKDCVILDAPFDCPIEGFQGTQIIEWGTWVRYWEQGGTPRGIWKELLDRFPLPSVEPGAIVQQNIQELRRLRERLIRGAALKAQAVKWLMTRRAWDLFVVIFPEPHPAGHYFWNLDSTSPPGSLASSGHTFLRDVYSAVDTAIGQIVADLDKQVTLFVVSGDGMGPNYSGWHLLPDVLRNLGFLVVNGGSFQEGSGGAVSNQNDLLHAIRNKIPARVRRAISRRLPDPLRFRLWRRWSTIPIDWSRTRAYYVPAECEAHIRINVKGREPSGCVEEGGEYDTVCQELSERLRELVNPRTGLRAVREIVRTDKVFPGSGQPVLPDLILQWDQSAKVTTELYSERCGVIAKPYTARDLCPYYVGNHKSPGFALVTGPGIARGQRLDGRHIIDLAPTLLGCFGVPRPALMDGKVWDDVWPVSD